MKQATLAIWSLLALCAAAAASTRAYSVEPVEAGRRVLVESPGYVSQVITANFDSLEGVELFVGNVNPGGRIDLQVRERPGGRVVDRAAAEAIGRGHGWARFEDWQERASFTKGRTYEFRFLPADRTGEVECFYSDGSEYGHGRMVVYGDSTGFDLCCRVEGKLDPVSEELWGVNCNLARLSPDHTSRALGVVADSMGFNWVRDDFASWNRVGARAGSRRWGNVLDELEAFGRERLSVLAILCYCNDDTTISTWPPGSSSGQGRGKYPPRNLFLPADHDSNHWARYVEAVMDTLRDVECFMVWNEPNIRDIYFGNPDTARRGYGTAADPVDAPRERCSLYVRMCRLARQVADRVPGRQFVVAGGVSHVGVANEGLGKTRGVDWLRDMLDIADRRYGGARGCFDAVSVHPYPRTREFDSDEFHEDLDTVRSAMSAFGAGDMELWVTETGWNLYRRERSSYVDIPGTHPERNACNLAKFYVSSAASRIDPKGGYERVFWYELTDYRDSRDGHAGFGLLDSSPGQQSKPASHAAAQLVAVLEGRASTGHLALDGSHTQLLEFEDPETGRRTWIAWSEDGRARTEKVPVRTDRAQTMLLDYDGTEEWSGEAASSDGWLRVQVTERPLFIRERPNDRLSRPDLKVDSVRFLSGDPRVGTADTLRAWVRNPGTRTTPARVPVRVRFRHEGTPLGDAQLPGAIPGGGTAQADIAFASLPGWMRGRGLIAAEANPDNDFVELDEADNKAYLVVQVR